MRSGPLRHPAALLVLLPAPARTGVVAADLGGHVPDGLQGLAPRLGRGGLVPRRLRLRGGGVVLPVLRPVEVRAEARLVLLAHLHPEEELRHLAAEAPDA